MTYICIPSFFAISITGVPKDSDKLGEYFAAINKLVCVNQMKLVICVIV